MAQWHHDRIDRLQKLRQIQHVPHTFFFYTALILHPSSWDRSTLEGFNQFGWLQCEDRILPPTIFPYKTPAMLIIQDPPQMRWDLRAPRAVVLQEPAPLCLQQMLRDWRNCSDGFWVWLTFKPSSKSLKSSGLEITSRNFRLRNKIGICSFLIYRVHVQKWLRGKNYSNKRWSAVVVNWMITWPNAADQRWLSKMPNANAAVRRCEKRRSATAQNGGET